MSSLTEILAEWRDQTIALGCRCVDFDPINCRAQSESLPFDDIDRAAAFDEIIENPCECRCHEGDPTDD